MKRKFCFYLFLIFILNGNAQVEFKPFDYYSNTKPLGIESLYVKDSTLFVFGDLVNVRKSASEAGEIIAQLQIGQSVKVLDSEGEMVLNGLNRPWVKVEFQDGEDVGQGYVWGGLLALGGVDAGKYTLLLGLSKFVTEPAEGRFENEFEVRVCEGMELLGYTTQTVYGSETASAAFGKMDNRDISNWKGGLFLVTGGGACGISTYVWHVFFDGTELISLPVVSGVGDGGVFYETTDYIFPDQMPDWAEKTDQIYVAYSIYESGFEMPDGTWDEVSSTEKTIIRPLLLNNNGEYVLPDFGKGN